MVNSLAKATRGRTQRRRPRRAAALLSALFIMTVCSTLVVSILETESQQYAALRNTIDWDRARYLAEAGIQHALAELEQDIDWRIGAGPIAFPAGSSNSYVVTLADGPGGIVIVTSTGTSGTITRRLETRIKQGG